MSVPGPLLVAMAGGKPRARRERIPVPKESKLHKDVADLLRDHCVPDWRWRFIDTRAGSARAGAIAKRMGANPGWPDFILLSPDSGAHFLELKRVGEEIEEGSPQSRFRDWCIAYCVPHVVAWTIDQVLFELDRWGCLRIQIPKRGIGWD
jgi:hypothetical protein